MREPMFKMFDGTRSTEIIFHSAVLVKQNVHDEITFTLRFRAIIAQVRARSDRDFQRMEPKDQR